MQTRRAWLGTVLGAVLLSAGCAGFAGGPRAPGGPDAQAPLPWEIWRDLRLVAQIPEGDQVLLRSSYCPSGCRYDRHSAGDSRFLRVDGDEGVIFDEAGPGAIVRLWMTTGDGVSQPLDPSVRIRFYFDDESKPRLDLPLPALFDGSTPPFVPPHALDLKRSSGGFVSYVPMPFARRCRIALVGAADTRLWFQVGFHRLAAGTPVPTFDPKHRPTAWNRLLRAAGSDPWPAGGIEEVRSLTVQPGQEAVMLTDAGPGLIEALQIAAEPASWPRLRLRMRFDGQLTVDLPVVDFFAVGRDPATAARSLLLGVEAEGRLYTYFPLPYERSARISLALAADAPAAVPVRSFVRRSRHGPLPHSGRFAATLIETPTSKPGRDVPVLRNLGAGKWVGLYAELGSIGTRSRAYLEGDEHVYVDDASEPTQHGTGVEDFFGGGFYFDQGPFRHPLHGMVFQGTVAPGTDVTAAYRLLLVDAVPFRTGLRVSIEAGPENQTPIRARTVAYWYRAPRR